MRIIEKQLYKITKYYGRSEFVESDNIKEVAEYVGKCDKSGDVVRSVTEINYDGTHPRVAICKLKEYRDAVGRR